MQESKRQVKAGLASQQHDIDHDAILASLQDEIDRHNELDAGPQDDSGHRSRRPRERDGDTPSVRFRFKAGTSEPKKRKHRSRDEEHRRNRRHKKERHEEDEVDATAHPFPREPVDFERPDNADSNAAFRESLFDALADDEGAAYWESVYSQPIHVYARPRVENAKGELEEMTDDEYATYVQTQMWEKRNPHIVLERERREKQRKEEEEQRARAREEFVRRKQRAAWEHAQRDGAKTFAGLDGDQNDYEYVFDFEAKSSGGSNRTSEDKAQHQEYHNAWKQYLAAWEKLKHELVNSRDSEGTSSGPRTEPSKRIPWPVLQTKPVIKANIEDFMRFVPLERDGPSRVQLLKAERVKWHPDKVQQRFGGQVDDGTMKVVTGVFQVVDALLEDERKREGGG